MTSAMPPSSAIAAERPAQNGFLDGLQIPADQLLMMGMTGPSMNTLKKSQSAVESKHPCVYQYGSCSFGDECKFAEIDGKVCAKFLKGGCSWGNNCCWKHTTIQKITAQNKMEQSRRMNGGSARRFEEPQDELYNGLQQQQQQDLPGMGFNNDMQQRNIFQQLQMQQQLNGLPPNLLANDVSLPGMQNFGLDDRCFTEQLQQALPFHNMGDEETMNQSQVTQLMSTILGSIREFDDRHNARVSQLQMAIEMAEKERTEEGDRNRRSISALMSSVDHLMGKLKDLGIPVGGLPQQMSGPDMDRDMVPQTQTPMGQTISSPVSQGTEQPKMKICQHCGKSGKLMLCGRCKVATFCNQQCQREAWSTHSKTCTPPRPAES
eukprot:TRINITY_DN1320_c0_g2_i5.p1 TRINITY_DN1320_c0_g2~~TRINITY_DN1320_c0_g2_i5.p1  ORF type:complete len:377 (+),score=123.45 TRINITY_DN1320_c0_g2_i5:57-1187(+)